MDKQELTQLLERYRSGDEAAFQRLVEEIYDDLRRIAHLQLGNHKRDAVVNTTVIVHEAYFRLREQDPEAWSSKAHFMAIASRAMRQIIIDFARRSNASKRGGDAVQVSFDDTQVSGGPDGMAVLLDIDATLTKLSREDVAAARLFEFRFFGGMTDQEAADALGLSLRSTQRQWKMVKAYFAHALA